VLGCDPDYTSSQCDDLLTDGERPGLWLKVVCMRHAQYAVDCVLLTGNDRYRCYFCCGRFTGFSSLF